MGKYLGIFLGTWTCYSFDFTLRCNKLSKIT